MTIHRKSAHLLDRDLVGRFDAVGVTDVTAETLPAVRAGYNAAADAVWLHIPQDMAAVDLRTHRFPGAAGDPEVEALVVTPLAPRDTPRPVILHVHGGGYVIGNPEGELRPSQFLARLLDAVVVLPRYRLAPETPQPGTLNDCQAALRWLAAHAVELGIDPARIAISGVSAGGGLAAGLALLNRDTDWIPICHLHLSNPMLDDRTGTSIEPSAYVGEFGWSRVANTFGWTSLLGRPAGSADVPPHWAPGRMEDLAGLPPTFLSCGALDLFAEESIDFARRLVRGGVATELILYPGAPHGFALGLDCALQRRVDRDDRAAFAAAFGIAS